MHAVSILLKAKRKAAHKVGGGCEYIRASRKRKTTFLQGKDDSATDCRRSSWRNGVLVSDCKESKTLKRSECGVSEGQVGAGERIDNQSWDKGHEAD